MAIVGAIADEDVSILCARLLVLAERSPTGVVICDVGGAIADLRAVRALAYLQLAARRRGWRIQLRAVSPSLTDLIDLCGLRATLLVDL